jgi:hydroxymethylpyrimidine pyrophosphatase-like HAD family hydrolase
MSLPRLRNELLETWLAPHPELTLHHNGNNLAVIPKGIDKAHAVRFLIEHYRREHPELLILGAGDSQSDADFLQLCDYALIPKNTQLMRNIAKVS